MGLVFGVSWSGWFECGWLIEWMGGGFCWKFCAVLSELAGLFCVGGESWVLQISFVDVVGWMRTVLGVRFGGVVKWCWCCYLAIEDWSRIFFLQGARSAPMKGVLESPRTPFLQFLFCVCGCVCDCEVWELGRARSDGTGAGCG